jgi:DNA-binding CsgD family transcriptional regulator
MLGETQKPILPHPRSAECLRAREKQILIGQFSPREQDVLNALAKGYSYKETADLLSVSYSTVHTHIERIYHKLHVQSRGQAVAKYLGA